MFAIFSILLVGSLFYYFTVPPLLGVSVLVLALPLLLIPIEPVLGFSCSLFLCLFVLFISIYRLFRTGSREIDQAGVIEFSLLAPVFFLLRRITAQWTEFYNIGEHIRDFTILSAVTRDPIFTKEPWLDSLSLYYYTYWYRVGYLFKKLFNFTTAETYHYLICFSFALLFVLLLRVSRTVMKLTWAQSLFVSSITVFGSNILGVVTASKDGFWWGPSRAVSAGITEFPVWSFILGDLHPHFLSLVFQPLILLMVGRLNLPLKSWRQFIVPVITFLCAANGFIYGANSWDVVGYTIFALPVLAAIIFGDSSYSSLRFSLLGFTLCLCVAFLSLLLAPRLGENPLVLKLLTSEDPQISAQEFLMHWGSQFCFLIVGLLIAVYEISSTKGLFLSLLLVGAVFYSASTLLLLFVFLVLCLAVIIFERKIKFSLALCIGSLLVLIFTELFYFDDSYNGVNQRLNTIFKLYYFCWIPLTLGSLAYFCDQIKKLPLEFRSRYFVVPSAVATSVVMLAFFAQLSTGKGGRSLELQGYIEPRIEGLSFVEHEVPGSADVILKLRALPSDLRVLEHAEPAYSSSANICSLSEHNCYIGWRNHLLLQYKDGLAEYDRRESISKEIYGSSSCDRKLKLAVTEKIGAVIFGPNELEAYPALRARDFSCFSSQSSLKQITVYSP